MSKTDVEMEDTENLPNDTGDSFQESEIKVLDEKSEIELEKCLADAVSAGDVTKCVNGGEDSVTLTNKETESTDNSNIEPQVIHESEAVLDMQNEIIGEKQDQINAQDIPEEQIHTESVVEEQIDAKTGLAEHNASNGGLGEKISPATDAVVGDHVENMIEESPSNGIVEKSQHEFEEDDCVEHVSMEEENVESAADGNNHKDIELPSDTADNVSLPIPNGALDDVPQVDGKEKEDSTCDTLHKTVKSELNVQDKEMVPAESITDRNSESTQSAGKYEAYHYSLPNNGEAATPHSVVAYSPSMAGQHSVQKVSTFTQATPPMMAEGEDGTAEDQAAFMKELDIFHRERALDFKPPKFYGQQLNCLKLWRSVVRLGGYERVTASKLWRQVGESFHPPKTCTTVSWTFRIFYEKSLLEYEKYKRQTGEIQFTVTNPSEASGVDKEANGYQGSEPGRGRRDSASRAMQGWHGQHGQRLLNGEVVEPVMKDKSLSTTPKREKTVKSVGLGSLKQKRPPNELENSSKIARIEMSKQLVASVVDIGPPADWVKINVRQTNECFEVYALVPGLLREEVRVQSDPAGRLVITGQPEQVDNPWGITPFKKVVSLPERIDPLRTSAVVSLHGRLLVRVPFAQPEN